MRRHDENTAVQDEVKNQYGSDVIPSPGTITGIVQQKKDRERCSVHIDGTFAFGVHSDVVLKEGLHSGMILDTEAIERLLLQDAYWRAWKRVTQFISYRPRSTQEIRRRLARDRFDETVITRILNRLTELGLIDDRKLAEEFARARIRSKGYGLFRIKRDLMRIGISRTLCDETISEVVSPDQQQKLAELAGKKLWKRFSKEADRRRRHQKWTAAMLRRGFSSSDAIRVLETLEQEHDNG